MDPINYLRIARGRWKVIASVCLLGLVAGWVTAPTKVVAASRTFSATHTLIVEPGSKAARNDVEGPNVDTTALLVTAGEVPKRAAQALAMDPAQLVAAVVATPDATQGKLDITASLPDGERAAAVANTLAQELQGLLASQAQERYNSELEAAKGLLASLQEELDALPPGAVRPDDVETAQRGALIRRFDAASDRVQELEAAGTPTSGFISLAEAVPVEVDARTTASQSARAKKGEAAPVAAAPVQVRPPEQPPARWLRVLIAGLVGLLLGIGLALLSERLDARVRSKDAAERAFRFPVIAEIPRLTLRQRRRHEIAIRTPEQALGAQAYRLLRASPLFRGSVSVLLAASTEPRGNRNGLGGVSASEPPVGNASGQRDPVGEQMPARPAPTSSAVATPEELHVPAFVTERRLGAILVTSAGAGEGKTTATANLAAVLGEAGKSVLALDVDLRRPTLHQFFDQPRDPGLGDVLDGESTLDQVTVTSEVPGVRVVASGRPVANPSEVLDAACTLVATAREEADVVVLDTPPLLATSDASELMPAVDVVLIVCRTGKTTVDAATRCSEQLARLGAPVLGVVLTGAPIVSAARSYHSRVRRGKPRPARRTDAPLAPTPPQAAKTSATSETVKDAKVAKGANTAKHGKAKQVDAAPKG